MDPTEMKLAELVRKHPNLYDQSRRDYKDNLRGHLSWREIAGVMEMSEGEVRMMWRNLRDKFCKAKKRVAKRSFLHVEDSAGNPVEKPIPKLYCQLAWLGAHVQPRTEESCRKYTTKEEGMDDVDEDKKEQLNPLPVITTILSPADSSPSSVQTIEASLKCKKPTSTQTKPCADALRDEDELFLLSLLPSLKRLTIKRRMEVRMKFQQVLYAAEFEN
ncbi:uncharacterized protein LOC106513155 [Austrofundulus limnaeus]|uniref:Uncharacterized protein LOC106513155 n=1 Tax=Austrofundulus limnaeus TaxID=52670 RepID=A0A2I4AP67_AUSLI|nr:PREDICTED: uncharacterized protein LOC106513155 [Austrofundulus limnaeus]